jgi:hypothetical protein
MYISVNLLLAIVVFGILYYVGDFQRYRRGQERLDAKMKAQAQADEKLAQLEDVDAKK